MKKLRKILSIFLILLTISGYFPDNNKTSYAASVSTFYLTAYSFDSGTLTLRWPTLANCQSVWVTFHSPTNPVTATEIKKDQITNTIDIPGLLDDIIYDIKLEVYDGAGCTGNKIGRGFFYFCPNISFRSKILDQSRKAVTGGGFEIGTSPALNLQWTIPKVWVEGSDTFEYANQPAALLDMQSKINSFYNDTRVLSTLNFRINISTDYSNLNSGSAQSALIISQVNPAIPSDPITYSAIVSGSSLTASVNDMDSSGQVNFDLIGRASSAADLPTAANAYQLPDADIIPGTVYYMNIKPIIRNTAGAAVNAITVGPGMNQNGSRLLGAVPYTYSPIRFQISRDDANNVYVKVFRINQGSLDLPALKYEVQTGDDPTIEGDWKVRKSLNDSYFPNNSPYALTAFTVNNPNNPLYYKVVVKTDASSDRLESPKMPYTLNEDNSRPPVPTNLTVTDRTASPGDVIDPTNNTAIAIKSTDVTISWNKPSNWNEIISANPYNESNDVYFHFVISTNQVDLTSLPYPQLEFNGKVFGEYQAKYRLMKYVSARSPNIIQDGNRLSYTIKSLELFKGEDADGISDNDIPNPDKYPTFLIPNKIYFLQMYTA
ncbi:MAG: ferrous iron transporter A, partial [Bacillota bacterium]|nr:ferrous iron transporter A [Bacillota bacterium]